MTVTDKNEVKNKQMLAMAELFARIDSAEDFLKLFDDVCTYKELEQMALRLNCAYLLKNNCTYNGVMQKVDVSSATLSRVSRCLTHGSGGYTLALEKYGYKIDDNACEGENK